MKKITLLLFIAILLLPSTVIFAQDAPDNATDSSSPNSDSTQTPDPLSMPSSTPPAPGTPMGSAIPGMPRTVVATSDGGIVIVEGNKVTKLDQNLEITKSIVLTNTKNK
jgi:hypothetical protein